MSPASGYNSPAGGAGFIRYISARRERETDAGTLYFHWGVHWLCSRYSSVHFEQRGAARSPTTLALSMLQALTRPLLAWRNHPCSPNLGKCQRASPDCIGGANWALAVPLVSSEDIAPMTVPMPTRAAPSIICFIEGLL
jgi:hypothetical protein